MDRTEIDRGNARLLNEVVAHWPTPAATDASGARNRTANRTNPVGRHHDGVTLNDAIILWTTPRASDGEKGGPNQAFGAGGIPLASQTARWPTPTSLSYGESHQPGNSRSYNRTMELASSLQDLATHPVGGMSSSERRTLNPLFVEWLMGWPPGWTLLAWIDFACSATELFRWKQRMRSALLRLGLPDEAPLQLGLFA